MVYICCALHKSGRHNQMYTFAMPTIVIAICLYKTFSSASAYYTNVTQLYRIEWLYIYIY